MNKNIFLVLTLLVLTFSLVSADPTFTQTTSSDSEPYVTSVVNLSTNITGSNMDSVWLATNETGTWVNSSKRPFGKLYKDFAVLSETYKRRDTGIENSDLAYLYLSENGYIGSGLNATYKYSSEWDFFNVKHQFSNSSIDFSDYDLIGYYAKPDDTTHHKTKPLIYDSDGLRCDTGSNYANLDSADWEGVEWDFASFNDICNRSIITSTGFQINDRDEGLEVEGSVLFDEWYITRTADSEITTFNWKNNNIREEKTVNWKICANNTAGEADCTSEQTLELKTYQEDDQATITQESGSIYTRLYDYDDKILSSSSNKYRQPNQEEKETLLEAFKQLDKEQYQEAAITASKVNYTVVNFTDTTSNENYMILENGTNGKGWGYYVIYTENNNKDLLIQVVHPTYDQNTVYYGADTFINSSARYYFLSGSHRYTNLNEMADPAHNSESVFRELTGYLLKPSLNVLQIHGFATSGHDDYPENVIADGDLSNVTIHNEFCTNLRNQGLSCGIVNTTNFTDLGAQKNVLGKDTRDKGATFIHVESNETVRSNEANRFKFVEAVKATWSTNDLTLHSLEDVYISPIDTKDRTFRFNIKNYGGSDLEQISFNLTTGDGDRIDSTIDINLTDEEEILIFVTHNYTTTGTYNVTAQTDADGLHDEQTITIILASLALFSPTLLRKKKHRTILLLAILILAIVAMPTLKADNETNGTGQRGGGGLPICEGMELLINLTEDEIEVADDFETKLYGKTIGPEAGCSIDVIWWETNQSGTWKQIPADNQSVPLDCTGDTCKENNPSLHTWYARDIGCYQSGVFNVRGKMQYDEPYSFNKITTSSVEAVTCYANESMAREAIEQGIQNSELTYPNIKTDQQIYIVYFDDTQKLGSFDKTVTYNNQTWAFNYNTTGETMTGMDNLTDIVYIWEAEDMTYNEIVLAVEVSINNTIS